MTKADLFDIQSIREDFDFEVKAARGADGKGQVPRSFWETYSAMANTDGGYIFLGVSQKGSKLIVTGIPDIEKVKKELWDNLNNPKKVSVNLLSNKDVISPSIQGKSVLQIHVSRATRRQRPVYLNANPLGNTFRRNFEGDYKCSDADVKQMLGEQTNDTRDAVLLDRFGINDLWPATFALYRQHFSNRNPHHPFNDLGTKDFLINLGGWVKNRQTEVEGLSLAGLLMFGKLRSILEAVPNYILDYQERPRAVAELRWIDRVTTDFSWSGNLYDFYLL